MESATLLQPHGLADGRCLLDTFRGVFVGLLERTFRLLWPPMEAEHRGQDRPAAFSVAQSQRNNGTWGEDFGLLLFFHLLT